VIFRLRAPVFFSCGVGPLVRTSHPSGSRHGRFRVIFPPLAS